MKIEQYYKRFFNIEFLLTSLSMSISMGILATLITHMNFKIGVFFFLLLITIFTLIHHVLFTKNLKIWKYYNAYLIKINEDYLEIYDHAIYQDIKQICKNTFDIDNNNNNDIELFHNKPYLIIRGLDNVMLFKLVWGD